MKNYLIIALFLILATSCGKSSAGERSATTSEEAAIESKCLRYSKGDSLQTIAMKAHLARTECGLSEARMIVLLKRFSKNANVLDSKTE